MFPCNEGRAAALTGGSRDWGRSLKESLEQTATEALTMDRRWDASKSLRYCFFGGGGGGGGGLTPGLGLG